MNNNFSSIRFPIIKTLFPSLIALEFVGIQPMYSPLKIEKRWEIIKCDDKWMLRSWYNNLYSVNRHDKNTLFDTEEDAKKAMILEKFEE